MPVTLWGNSNLLELLLRPHFIRYMNHRRFKQLDTQHICVIQSPKQAHIVT